MKDIAKVIRRAKAKKVLPSIVPDAGDVGRKILTHP
jgi:hypothetical protein